jgi:hypothetical protein
LTKTTAIPFSAQCRYGGTKIESGVDTNRNGILDASEVTSTQIVCNGSSDIQLKSISSTNTNYPNGGAQLLMFMPGPGGGGSADTVEIDGAVFPNNTLTKTSKIASGTQCPYGGTKIETGVDSNRNGILDASEVDQSKTQIICNSYTNTAYFTSATSSTGTSWVCPQGVTQVLVKVQGAGGAGGNGLQSPCNSNTRAASSGAGGGYAEAIIPVTPGNTYTVIVGAGGQLALGGSGSSSKFTGDNNLFIQANGGEKGYDANCINTITTVSGGTVQTNLNSGLLISAQGAAGKIGTFSDRVKGGKSKAYYPPRRIVDFDENEFGQGGSNGIMGSSTTGESGAEGYVIICY